MVTCEVRNRLARSTTRTLPSCCIISRMARRRSSLSRLFPSAACMSLLWLNRQFLLYRRLSFVYGLFGRDFEQQVFVERRGEARGAPRHCPKTSSSDVIDNAVLAVFQAAQFQLAFPMLGEKGVVQRLVLADHMGLGQVEADVVKLAKILSPREHLFAIDAQPLLEF